MDRLQQQQEWLLGFYGGNERFDEDVQEKLVAIVRSLVHDESHELSNSQ